MKRPIIPEREKLQTLSAVQGSLLLILRNSKFGVLAAHLSKNKATEKRRKKERGRKEPQRGNFLAFTWVPHDQKSLSYTPRMSVTIRERWGGEHRKKQGQSRSFRLLGCCFLLHAALLIQRRI